MNNLPTYYVCQLIIRDQLAVLIAQRVVDLSLLILNSPYPTLCDEDLENVRNAFKKLRDSKSSSKVRLHTKRGIAHLHKDI